MTKSSGPITATQLTAIGVCVALNIIDGMDVLVVAYAGPRIISEWRISAETYGAIFSAGVFGMTMGAFFLAPFADIIGRRKAILASIAVISIGMLTTAFAQSVEQLMALRFVVGLGIGIAGPVLSTIVVEYSPERYRDLAVSVLGAGYAIGAMLTGVVAAWLIPEYGWRAMFAAAAVTSGLMLPVAFLLLPESLEFLLKKQPRGALQRANALLGKLGRPQLDALPAVTVEKRSGLGVGNLVAAGRRRSTMALWTGFFMVYAVMYFLLGFIPKIAVDMGLPLDQAIYVGTALNTGGLLGTLVLGFLATRYPLVRVILVFQLAAAGFMVAFGVFTPPLPVLLVLAGLVGFFSLSGLVGLIALATRLYPTELRATGVGWGQGMGRAGAIAGPIVGGVLIGLGYSRAVNFSLFAGAFVLVALMMIVIRLSANSNPGRGQN